MLQSRLVERERETAEMAALLGRAQRGEGGVAVVTGPAGIGKTALLDTVVGEAPGFRTLRGRCGEVERELSFGLVRDLLVPLVRAAGSAVRSGHVAKPCASQAENLADVERFDLVWLPLPVLLTGCRRTGARGSAVSRLRFTLWGGAPLADETLAALLGRVGFTDIRGDAAIPMAPTRARRPPG